MGLDMYLSKKISLWGVNEKESKVVIKGKEYPTKNLDGISYEVAYWRKFNALHGYFVDNVQGGVDDCGEYKVSVETLMDIIQKCKKDIAYLDSLEKVKYEGNDYYYSYDNLDEGLLELLPQPGFFFGSTEVDSYFYNSLVDTVKMLDEALEAEEGYFYYTSSW